MAEKKEVVQAVGSIKNNTKGLRHVAGVKIMPSETVKLTHDQIKNIKDNDIAMAWIEAGDLSLT